MRGDVVHMPRVLDLQNNKIHKTKTIPPQIIHPKAQPLEKQPNSIPHKYHGIGSITPELNLLNNTIPGAINFHSVQLIATMIFNFTLAFFFYFVINVIICIYFFVGCFCGYFLILYFTKYRFFWF